MRIKKIIHCLVTIGIVSGAGFCSSAHAAAFQLFEQNAVNMGDVGAGGAAIADDASTAYFNPAGLIRIPNQQVVISGDLINTDFKFTGTNTWTPLGPTAFLGSYTESANGVQGGGANFVPAFHYAAPINDCFVLGFSVTAPYGLETNYPQTSALRYSATRTSLEVIDLGPSFGLKLNNHWSVGAGFDAEHLSVDFNSIAGIPALNSDDPTQFDSLSKNSGTDWGYGWHAGVLYQFDCATRVGLTYHSQVVFSDIRGHSKLIGPLANFNSLQTGVLTSGVLTNNQLAASATLPPSTTLSFYHDVNQQLAFEGSIIYTEWSKFNKTLTLNNVQAISIDPSTFNATPTLIQVNVPQNFSDSLRFAVGTVYKPWPCFWLRGGLGFDRTPTNSTDRNQRLPDADRFAVALGAHYQVVKQLGVDAGWTHMFIQDTNISSPAVTGMQQSTAFGQVKSHADLIGVQLTYDFI